jgi:peptidoglycan/xylan/chitin deacetylase (PgdA/CDA1 family)
VFESGGAAYHRIAGTNGAHLRAVVPFQPTGSGRQPQQSTQPIPKIEGRCGVRDPPLKAQSHLRRSQSDIAPITRECGSLMRGKKALLGDVWGGLGLATATLKLASLASRQLVILAYHRVLDIGDEDSYPGDPELVSASVQDFEAQMRFVRDHMTPLTLAAVLEALDRGRSLPARSVVVTFDDGHADNYTNAFPILKSLGVPATIFLSTAYIDAVRTPFWFERIAELLFFAPNGSLTLGEYAQTMTLGDIDSRRQATYLLLRQLKRDPNPRRLALLGELEKRLGPCVPADHAGRHAAMTWDQVREMSDAGIEFGSHTVSHPILARLEEAQIVEELSTSRECIRAHTGQAVDAVAYPVGKADAYDDRVLRAARACGYRIGLSYESGVNRHLGADLFELRRLAVERYVSLGNFKAMLSLPRVFA